MNNKSILFLSLIIIAVTMLVAKGAVDSLGNNFGPEKQASAEAIKLAAQANADRQALQLKYDQIRGDIMVKAIAERDRKIELDKAEAMRIGELNTLNADYQRKLAEIQKDIDWTHAVSNGGVILVMGFSIALVLVAFAFVVHVRNRAQVVRVGDEDLIFQGGAVLQPSNSLSTYIAAAKMPRLVEWYLWWQMVRSAGKPADGDPSWTPWKTVEDARKAIEPRFKDPQIQNPEAILALKQGQAQSRMARILASRMNNKEAKAAAADLAIPQPVQFGPAPEIGWLPAPVNDVNAYDILASEAEDR